MRRGSSNLIVAAALGVALMSVPILDACMPYDASMLGLGLPAKLLLVPGALVVGPVAGNPDLPILVFANWLFYSTMLWPIVALFRRSR